MIALVTFLIFISSLIGFVIGFGTSTILIPALLFWYSVHTVLILVGLLHLFNDFTKIFFLLKDVPWRLATFFSFPAIVMSFVGAQLTFLINRTLFLRLLGIILLMYVLIEWFYKTVVLPRNRLMVFGGGCLYGFLQGLTGVGGALRAAILTSYHMKPAEFIAANGFIALLVDLVRVGTYISHGFPLEFAWWHYLLFIMVVLLSAVVGKYLIYRLPVKLIQQLVLIAIFMVSLKFIFLPH